jgi:hypothetical protein
VQAANTYDWTRLDSLVDQAFLKYPDAKLLYTIGATPQWLAKVKDPCIGATPPCTKKAAPWLVGHGACGLGSNSVELTDVSQFNQFIATLAARYNGTKGPDYPARKIHAFEMWNEPQLPFFMTPWKTSLPLLTKQTKEAVKIIHEWHKSALVLSSPMLPRGSNVSRTGGMKRVKEYLDSLKKAYGGAIPAGEIDVWSTHIYPLESDAADKWELMLNAVTRGLADASLSHKKVKGAVRI